MTRLSLARLMPCPAHCKNEVPYGVPHSYYVLYGADFIAVIYVNSFIVEYGVDFKELIFMLVSKHNNSNVIFRCYSVGVTISGFCTLGKSIVVVPKLLNTTVAENLTP